MAYNHYNLGDAVQINCTFKSGGVATDPTTVTLTVYSDSAGLSTYTYGAGQIVKSDTGIYYKVITPAYAETYRYRWVATGTVVTARANKFIVENY